MVQTQDPFLQQVAADFEIKLPVDAPELADQLTTIVDSRLYRRQFDWAATDPNPAGGGGFVTILFDVPAGEAWCFSLWHQENASGDEIRAQGFLTNPGAGGFDPMVIDFDIPPGEQATLVGDVNANAQPQNSRFRRPKCLVVYPGWQARFRFFNDGGVLDAGTLYKGYFIWEVLPASKLVTQRPPDTVNVPGP